MAEVEVGTETYEVSVAEVVGAERDGIYAQQARRYQGFAEYEARTAGIRTIPCWPSSGDQRATSRR